MKKNSASQSAFFNPRVVLAFALCSCGVLLGMFSLAATPPAESTITNLSAVAPLTGAKVDHSAFPPGVPLPGGARFSPNGQSGPFSNTPASRFPNFKGLPFQQGTANGANQLGNLPSANQQPAGSASTPNASAAQSGWSIVSSPNGAGALGTFDGVTCVSASDCWAVGYYYSPPAYQTLVERWDGTAWAIVSSPNTSAAQDNILNSVTCVSASNCWAVGSYYNGTAYETLIERWDGTSWAIVSSPSVIDTQDDELDSVTCTSASDCWAVGSYYDNADIGTGYRTLIEHWDGTAWVIVSSPNKSATGSYLLTSVACVSASDCWAVGDGGGTLTEHWDGTSWAIVSSPNTSAAGFDSLASVTCVSASDCWAVGGSSTDNIYQTLIEHWDGTSWSIVTSANTLPVENNTISSVTCASASECWAVGYYEPRGAGSAQAAHTLIERWDGTSWTIVTSADTSSTQDNLLHGVTCVPASSCWAVGHFYNSGLIQTLTEHWDGTSWAIVTSPNTSTTLDNELQSVTCVSASDCLAVGYYVGGAGANQTLIERWNGTAWAIVASPNTSATEGNFLTGVACVSASDCWAVGYYINASNWGQSLIEHWDGTAWAIVGSPNTSTTQHNILVGVTCTSASDCWAVGEHLVPFVAYQTLIERWDGTSWAIVASPNTSAAQDNILNAVTCVSASDCWAVGYLNNPAVGHQTLVERWDGSSWVIVSSPNTSTTQDNVLNAVTCVSASDCWAVGYYYNGTAYETLIEGWDGTSWSIVSSPNTSTTQSNALGAVTCVSASNCQAVGYANDYTISGTLTEGWDGTSWTIISSPNTSTAQTNVLNGVTCVSASDCWAVGEYFDNAGVAMTLTEHYGLPFVQLNAVVSRKLHGTAGTFDINLPLTGNTGIECRSGGANGDYTLVFTFYNTLTSVDGASLASGTGSVTTNNIDGSDAHNYIVNVTGVTNAQVLKVGLTNVSDSAGEFSSAVAASMGVLLGDVDATGRVDGNDVSAVQSHTRQTTGATNYRYDVDVTGRIDGNDVSITQGQTRTSLP
jgi:hypothetical protein